MLQATKRREAPGRTAARLLLSLALLTGSSAWSQEAPEAVGQWSSLMPWPDTGTHIAVLPNGKLLSWTEFSPDPFHLWDPATNTSTTLPNPGYNAFCAGFSHLADGRLLVAGGHIESNIGLPHASIFDPGNNSWTRLPDMNAGRWYPTTTALPNGEMLVIAGTATAQRVGENRLPQVWQPDQEAWRDLTGAQRTLRTYPWMFVAPNGKVFMAGPDPDTGYLDTAGAGAWTPVSESLFGDRRYGSAVMYEEGKVMVSGGGDPVGTASVEVIDLNAPAPAWRNVQPMAQPRVQHNMTLLPDGTVLVTGGSAGPGKSDETKPVHAPELWDPATERFTRLAPDQSFRGYHSSAILLPDGRVLSLGGENREDAELFSPPYLFKGARPTITAGPAAVRYGESFTVTTPEAASIAKVTWIRAGAATHAFNQGQRINRLAFAREAGALRITAPANANLAPPGPYMLFLLTEEGVPSVAHWVSVGGPDAQLPEELPAIATGEGWKYDARGVAPEASWTSAAFDDSQWRTGQGAFGTGEGQAGTALQLEEGQSTVYFRKKVVLRGTAAGGRMVVQAEDGVAVWLNGTRVYSLNVEEGTDPSTWATGRAPAGGRSEVTVPAGVLVDGENQVAVMVKRSPHTDNRPNPPLRFDLELFANLSGQVEAVPLLSLQSPNGGDTFQAGSLVQVVWSTQGAELAEVRLEYSLDGGARWEPIEQALANTGSYGWRVPPLSSAQVLLRVAGASGPASADSSDAPFAVQSPAARVGEACGASGSGGPPCEEGAACVSGVCRLHCSAAADCSGGEVCAQLEGHSVCAPESSPTGALECGTAGQPECTPETGGDGKGGAGGCSASGSGPMALGLLLALGWAVRRRQLPSYPGGERGQQAQALHRGARPRHLQRRPRGERPRSPPCRARRTPRWSPP